MNEAWTWRPLGELFEIGAGKTMSAAARNGPHKIPFLRTSNILWDEIDLSSIDEMSIPENELPAKLLRRGDLLVCEGGEIGRAAIWDGQVERMSFQNHLHRLRPIDPIVESRFYVFFLHSAFTQLGIFEGAGNKTTIPNLSRSHLAGLKVPQPPLAEQQAVAQALGEVRAAIKVQDESITTVQVLKQAVMRILFTRGLRGEAQKETEIGPVPESWEVRNLRDCAERPEYGHTASASSEPIGPRLLRITDIQDGSVYWDRVPYCDCDSDIRMSKALKADDIVVARIGATTGKSLIIGECPESVFASYLIRLRTNQNIVTPPYLYHYLQTEQYWRHIEYHKGGRLRGGVNIPVLESLHVPLPTLTEQHEVVTILNAINHKIELHRSMRAVLEDLFNVLLYKLMTGEISVEKLSLGRLKENKWN